MTEAIEYDNTVLKVGGGTELGPGVEFEHGAQFYFLGSARVNEVAFTEKDGVVSRVHKGKLKAVVVLDDSTEAQQLISKMMAVDPAQSSIFDAIALTADEDPKESVAEYIARKDIEDRAEVLVPVPGDEDEDDF